MQHVWLDEEHLACNRVESLLGVTVEELDEFRQLMRRFDHPAFNWAVDLRSDRFRDLYFDRLTELIDLGVAGPFLSIASTGHCDYLFAQDRNQFLEVRNEQEFLDYCLALANRYRAEVEGVKPLNETEREDQALLLEQVALFERLSKLAFTILTNRNQHAAGATEA